MVGVLAHYWNYANQLEHLRAQVDQAGQRKPEARQRPRRMLQLTDEQVSEMIAARLAGAEIKELARQFHVHRSTVLANLSRQQVPHRTWSGRTLSNKRVQEAGQAYESGLSLMAVGERFNVDKRYLRRVLPDAGFVIRRPGRQP